MEIIISGRHLDLTDQMRGHVEERVRKIVDEYPKFTSARVVLELERNWHLVEIQLHAKHLDLVAKGRTTDMYASVDEAAEKLEKQLRKYLDKVQAHHPRHGQDTLVTDVIEEDESEAIDAEATTIGV